MILITGIEPVLFKKNQILSLTCLPIPPNELIPQFDLLTIGTQTFGLLISLYLFYYYCITNSISNFIEIKKLRTKKLIKNSKSISDIDKDLDNNLWLINYCYVKFLNTKMGV